MSVAILLSTYNGESYISAQLYSILSQMAPNDILIIRDDGSTDNTVQAIVEFSDPRIQLMHGINIGFVASFFELLRTVSWEHDVFMLADQDDVWLPDKISRASIALTSQDGSPHLYCSRLRLVDSQLNTLGLSPDYLKSLTWHNALIENVATGCTCAFNRAALKTLLKVSDTSRIHYHDWWFYLVISYYGKVTFDHNPSILYRQHEGNEIGMGSGMRRHVMIIKFLLKRSWSKIIFDQGGCFYDTYAKHLNTRDGAFIRDRFCNRRMRSILLIITSRTLYRQSFLGEIVFRILIPIEFLLRRV